MSETLTETDVDVVRVVSGYAEGLSEMKKSISTITFDKYLPRYGLMKEKFQIQDVI